MPPTCNLASTTGGITTTNANRGSAAPGNGMEDKIGPAPTTTISGSGSGGTVTFHQNNAHTTTTTTSHTYSGGRSQSFGSSFHGHVLAQVTSPYLAPEYPLLIKVRMNFLKNKLLHEHSLHKTVMPREFFKRWLIKLQYHVQRA